MSGAVSTCAPIRSRPALHRLVNTPAPENGLRPSAFALGETARLWLPADDLAVVDGPADQRPGAGTDDRAERLRTAGSDDVSERTAGDAAKNEPRRAVIASAVVTVVRTSINQVAAVQPPWPIAAIVAAVIPSRVPIVAAIVTPVPSIFTPVRPILSPILSPIPAVFLAIPPISSLRRRGQRQNTDER